MKEFCVILMQGATVIDRKDFDSKEAAQKYYQQTEPSPLLTLELWGCSSSANVAFGHKVHGIWGKQASKTGAEEFA